MCLYTCNLTYGGNTAIIMLGGVYSYPLDFCLDNIGDVL